MADNQNFGSVTVPYSGYVRSLLGPCMYAVDETSSASFSPSDQQYAPDGKTVTSIKRYMCVSDGRKQYVLVPCTPTMPAWAWPNSTEETDTYTSIRNVIDSVTGTQNHNRAHWLSLLNNPPDTGIMPWPVDVVGVGRDGTQEALLFEPFDERDYLPVAHMSTNVLRRPRPWFAKHAAVQGDNDSRTILRGVLNIWAQLERQGYILPGFNANRTFYRRDAHTGSHANVIMDFYANWADSLYQHLPTVSVSPIGFVDVDRDYADPLWYRCNGKASEGSLSNTCKISKNSAYFSLAAGLFRLLVGRLPFDGAMMNGTVAELTAGGNGNDSEHELWLDRYHDMRNAVFIFDPVHTENAIGGEDRPLEEQEFVDNWHKVPKKAQDMFVKMFRTAQMPNPDIRMQMTARVWQHELRDIIGEE